MKKLPLEGVRVLDLTMMWAGPFATMRLAEMGAEIWKIESPSAWDNIRTLLPQPGVADPWNSAYYFNAYNRDKKSVTLDLASEQGKGLFLRLVQHADVVMENYRAEVLDKLGLGWDVLHAARPDLVIVSMAAFGKHGRDASYVGFGPVIEMMSGLVSLSGYGDDGEPYKTGISYGDPVAGHQAVAAVVLGLIKRRRTGQGSVVDMAQRETGSILAGAAFVAASLRGEEPTQWGNRSPVYAPQGCYRAADSTTELGIATDEQWLMISVTSDQQWSALAAAIGRPELAHFSEPERRARHDELDEAIGSWTGGQDAQRTMEALQELGVPAGRVLDTGGLLDDPHLLRRGFWVYLPNPRMHRYKQFTTPWRFVEANPRLRRHSPLFGEHNREILGGVLGLSDEELAELASAGVIGDAPINPGVG
jgi:crotonobetainyl-CoA:carnitine CoA-transferase CaiB-like acyl-CoA transferase